MKRTTNSPMSAMRSKRKITATAAFVCTTESSKMSERNDNICVAFFFDSIVNRMASINKNNDDSHHRYTLVLNALHIGAMSVWLWSTKDDALLRVYSFAWTMKTHHKTNQKMSLLAVHIIFTMNSHLKLVVVVVQCSWQSVSFR